MQEDLSAYLSGKKLYGDDFSIKEIEKWFEDEAEGYADLGAKFKTQYNYGYHSLNELHAFHLIKDKKFNRCLGIGSAYGDEFKPIANLINNITILDTSDAFTSVAEIHGTPCTYMKPSPSGTMPFEDGQFDLLTSLGVMHHIPNVSHIIAECYRCLAPGGIMLLREPIVSMGDWTQARPGLTKRERGIPANILDEIVLDCGFSIKNRALCVFPIIPKLSNRLRISAFNNVMLTKVDAALSKLFSWNITYHRTKLREKIAPSSIYYVLEKGM